MKIERRECEQNAIDKRNNIHDASSGFSRGKRNERVCDACGTGLERSDSYRIQNVWSMTTDTWMGNNYELGQTVKARDYKDPSIVAYRKDELMSENNISIPKDVKYVVRRLTPTECARLQGFPDRWAIPDELEDMTDEQYNFWLNVRKEYDEINGHQKREYTKEQMLKWYNKLHTDAAEYKLWGNGIALPCWEFVMQGIVDTVSENPHCNG